MHVLFSCALALIVLSATPAAAASEVLDATFRHPLGVFFRHPSSWAQHSLNDQMLALVPADVLMHQGQPAEVVIVMGEDAPGIDDPGHSDVIATADQVVTGTFQYLAKSGEVQKRRLGSHDVAVVTWTGTSPNAQEVRARMWITLLEGGALAVFAAAPGDRLTAREPTLEAIVASFGYEAPTGDTRLVGSWRYTNVYMSGDFSMVDEEHLTLNADGSFLYGQKVMGGMQHSDEGGFHSGDTRVGTSSESVPAGRWRTQNKHITLEWNDGSTEEWDYLITATDLMFKSGSSKKLWERTR